MLYLLVAHGEILAILVINNYYHDGTVVHSYLPDRQ
jgi:hypothetical protein